MSFESNIKFRLLICKIVGIIYVPLNINDPPTFIDYILPLPSILSYTIFLLIALKIVYFDEIDNADREIHYSAWLYTLQCNTITITRWIYCFARRNKFQKCMININQFSMEIRNSHIIKKPKTSYIIIIIIALCVIINYIFYIRIHFKNWIFYDYTLPIEIATNEQYFIYAVNNELYLILKNINDRFASFDVTKLQNDFNKLIKTYDDYKKFVLLSHEINENIGFSLLCSLSVTVSSLIIVCYQLRSYVGTNMLYIYIFFLLKLYVTVWFTIYSWDKLTVQVWELNNVLN